MPFMWKVIQNHSFVMLNEKIISRFSKISPQADVEVEYNELLTTNTCGGWYL